MSGKQAKILSDQHIEDLLFFAGSTRQPDRNRAIVLLSMKAGLRAAEIRKLNRAGVSKSEIARRLQIGRTSVRRILAETSS